MQTALAGRHALELRVYSGKVQMPKDALSAGLGDHRIVITLCPGGTEPMRDCWAWCNQDGLILSSGEN